MPTRLLFLCKLAFTLTIANCVLTIPVVSQSQFTATRTSSETTKWQPFLINPVNVKVSAPPNKEKTNKQLLEIKLKRSPVDKTIIRQIVYCDAGSPAYRWNDIGNKLVTFHNINTYLRFPLSWMNMAIYDATLVAWKAKQDHIRKRPFRTD